MKNTLANITVSISYPSIEDIENNNIPFCYDFTYEANEEILKITSFEIDEALSDSEIREEALATLKESVDLKVSFEVLDYDFGDGSGMMTIGVK